MYVVFIFLFLISLLALIIGLIKPSMVKFPNRKKVALIFIPAFLVFFILALASPSPSTNPSSSNQSNQTPNFNGMNLNIAPIETIKISSSKLFSDYEANQVNADNLYKDKDIEITGVIANIGKDFTNTPYLLFSDDGFSGVQCMFSKENQSLATLNKGQKVTVIGTVEGQVIMNVLVTSCILMD